MDVRLAEKAGFCFGVKRAIALARKAATEHSGTRIATLGEIIHNRQVVEELKREGIETLDSLASLRKGDVLIIRSHGAVPETYEEAERKGLIVIDTTCPFVKAAQNHGKLMAGKGYAVIIIGKKDHPEVQAIAGHAKTDRIVSAADEIPAALEGAEKVAVISQTTVPQPYFEELTGEIRKLRPDAKIINTICEATAERQEAAVSLAKEVDVMVVIGGYHSSNTQKLGSLCKEIVETHHIETAEDLRKEWFHGMKIVGVTAGASTPDGSVQEVVRALKDEDL